MVKKRQHIEEVRFAEGKPLPIEALTLRRLVAKEGAALARPERPTFHLLMRVTQGEGTHVVDFVRHHLRVGAVLHVAPGQVQQFSLEGGFDATLVVFQPDFVQRPPPLLATPVHASGPRGETIGALFDAIVRELEAGPAERALLGALVTTLGLALEHEAPRDEGAALLRRFRDELELHFTRTHEVAAFAAVLRCSTRTLTRHCVRWLGKTPKQVIDARVVLEAKRLLAHGGQSVAAISAALGFAEATQFVKFFRRLARQTPASFRRAPTAPSTPRRRGPLRARAARASGAAKTAAAPRS